MYEQPLDPDLSQGDILDDCPILVWKPEPPLDFDVPPEIRIIRVVVLTQACDLAQDKTTRVVVAPVHDAAELVARNILKAVAIRDQVRRGQVFGWYFLPAAPAPVTLAESIVDLREPRRGISSGRVPHTRGIAGNSATSLPGRPRARTRRSPTTRGCSGPSAGRRRRGPRRRGW